MSCEYKLIRHNGPHPPGNFPYECPKTGRKFSGDGGIKDTAMAVTQFHLANPKIFTDPTDMDFEKVLRDVDCFQCLRLGNDPRFCTNGKSGSVQPAMKTLSKLCPNCGVKLNEKYCPTCSSRRLIGAECPKCHYSENL